MSETIELTTFKGNRLTVFKRWIVCVRELPAWHPEPRVCCTVFISTSDEGIDVQESYDDVVSALTNDSVCEGELEKVPDSKIKAVSIR